MMRSISKITYVLIALISVFCDPAPTYAKSKSTYVLPPSRPACEELDVCDSESDEVDVELSDGIKKERLRSCQATIAMHAFTDNLDKVDVGSKPAKIYVGSKFSELPFDEKQKLAAAAECVVVQGGRRKSEIEIYDGVDGGRIGLFKRGQLFLYEQID
ncbi:MAG: hypothetical protein ACKOPC_03750 [Methylocystis sp.]